MTNKQRLFKTVDILNDLKIDVLFCDDDLTLLEESQILLVHNYISLAHRHAKLLLLEITKKD